MKFFTAFISAFFCFHLGCRCKPVGEEDVELIREMTSTMATTPTTPSSQNDYLDNISIQDVLSSDVDASEKIVKKIINVVTQYASNCRTYRKINLSTEEFTFPENSITVDLGTAKVTFYNIRVSESYQNSSESKSYSTKIGCDSTKMSQIEVKIPNDLKIRADFDVTEITNSSNELKSSYEIFNKGSVTLTLKQNSILKQFSIQTDDADNETSKIFYSESAVSLKIATKFQMQIYNKLQIFFDAIEPHLRKFLLEKLNSELAKNGISVSHDCSKFVNTDKNLKQINLPLFNNNLNHLYVIPHSRLEMWKGVALSAGPILIDGLFFFNSTEFISETNSSLDTDGNYFYSYYRFYGPDIKEIGVKIKTNNLKGKVDWSYNSKQRSTPFIIEFIQFEVKKSDIFQYTNRHSNYYDPPNTRYAYTRSQTQIINVDLHFGNLQIKPSNFSVCENEKEFVDFVLSEYLKAVISDSLKNSLDRKIKEQSLFVDCD